MSFIVPLPVPFYFLRHYIYEPAQLTRIMLSDNMHSLYTSSNARSSTKPT